MTTIKICEDCLGAGEITERDRDGYTTETCSECNGTGRVIVNEFYFEVPFGFDQQKLYKAGSDIHAIMRKLDS